MSTTTAQVICPMHEGSCGEAVEADFGTFASTTVSVAACSSLLAQGWGDQPQWVGQKSYAMDRLVSATPTTTVVRHHDGLVTFTA